jgi:tetraacyldisaccharide 4'-kinase
VLSPSQFRDLVSGRRRGVGAALARAALRFIETPYAWAVRARNWRYDRGRAEIHRVAAPVVSVGNLTLGGTGKTPMVEWIARRLRARDIRVALVSRGYGAEGGSRNDEALELEQKLPDVPHLQDPDRVRAAGVAIEELASQLILLDDGFQHRRIARDLDLVLLDALEPDGFGHVFPRGTLREPWSGLVRADVVALSRADMIDAAARDKLRARVARVAPRAIWLELEHRPRGLLAADGREINLDALAGQRVAAFCGIGNPAGFRHTLETCGYDVAALREFPDHHAYSRDDIQSLAAWAAEQDVAAVVCTHKDLVKIGLPRLGNQPLWAVTIGIAIHAGQSELEARLDELVSRCPTSEERE